MFSRLFSEISRRDVRLSVIGSGILAFGLYNVHALSGVTEGGVLGLTLLLDHWFGISPAGSSLVLNALCYLLGWRVLGKRFIGLSIIAGGCFSAWYALLELFPPVWPGIAAYPLAAAVVGALFVGVGVGLCVRSGGAPGGDDALAMALGQLLHAPLQWIYFASDMIVLLLSLSYIPLGHIAYSLLTVILSGQIIGLVAGNKENKGKASH
ncbi:MAG: YitT family protein [Candidatus Limivicinus sp.]|nr:YitT family protein [Candidatus Limivicinus sp.]